MRISDWSSDVCSSDLILGERVIESKNRIAAAAGAWLALPADERYKTTLLPSSRDGRSEANQIIQDGLKAEGTLKGEGRAFNVRETLQLTSEEYRYARNWRAAHFIEVGRPDNGLGLPKGNQKSVVEGRTGASRGGAGER